jgi:hypothetical protein
VAPKGLKEKRANGEQVASAPQVRVVTNVNAEKKARRVTLARRVNAEKQEHKERGVKLGLLELKVQLVHRVRRVQLAQLVLRDCKV